MKTFIAVFAFAFASLCAQAQVYTGTALQNSGGNIARIVPFAPVTVCLASDTAVPCTIKATTFADSTLGVPCSLSAGNGAPLSGSNCNNPGIADANGNFTFFAASGNYHICTYAQNYQCVLVSTGSSGFSCGTSASPGIPFWNGTACLLDTNAQLDGNGNLTAVSATFSGAVTAASLATLGSGGILSLQFQQPPSTIPANTAYIYGNANTGLLDCLKTGSVECFSGVQLLASGSTAMPTSAISSGGCSSAVTVSATGVSTSSHIFAIPAADPTGVTGYAPSSSGSLYIQAYPTANNVNFKVCNNTSGSITPSALSLNWAAF